MSRNHTIRYSKDLNPTPEDLNYVMDTFGNAVIRYGTWFQNEHDANVPIYSSEIDGSPIAREIGYAVLCDGAHVVAHAPTVADTFNIDANHIIKMAYMPQMYEKCEPSGIVASPGKFKHAYLQFSMGDLHDIEYMLLRNEDGTLDPWAMCSSEQIADGEPMYLDGTPGKMFETAYQLEYSQVVCQSLAALAPHIKTIQADIASSDPLTRQRLSPQTLIAQQGGL